MSLTSKEHITVKGHHGTWYVIDEAVINGSKIYLLEHEAHGDEAACVAINEDGDLVADEIWNGMDEVKEQIHLNTLRRCVI